MVVDVQAVLAGLTIASGIFLAGRTFGHIEEKLKQKVELENEHRQQLANVTQLLTNHILGKTPTRSNEADGYREFGEE